ncbi:MAG: DUF4124 domain-containing protein [Thiobacillus sp.]|nr:DUF4124 domain-containing protein [Thiobacillus sp.]
MSLAATAHAEVYKWTDAQGKVHYSDQPPTVKVQTIKASSAGQAATTREATEALDAREQDYQKRRKDAEDARAKAEKEAEQARIKRENCERARKNLDALQNKPRVYSTNQAGQRVYLDDAGRAAALASSQKSVSENCK